MVIEKQNPIGIDIIVRDIQNALDSRLGWSELIDIYPRCYVGLKDNVRTIEHYGIGNSNDYSNLIYAEGNKCFFVQSSDLEKVDVKNYATTIELYFTVDLSEIYPDGVGRMDSNVHNDVLNALKSVTSVNVQRLVTGINRVYAGFDYKANDDNHPYHCFKVVLRVPRFDPKKRC